MGKLTELRVKNAKPGIIGDGAGLYLRVKPSGSKSWVLRVQHMGKREDIGLGGYPLVTLGMAREKSLNLRWLARDGVNARAARDKGRVRVPTFAEALRETHLEKSKGWSAKTADAFEASLMLHIVPKIGTTRVDQIGSSQIVMALASVWTEKPALAKKLRTRIMQVLSFAKSRGWRTEALPDVRELRDGLAKQPRGGNFAALHYAAIPAFMSGQLEKNMPVGRMALLFTILTAARSGEVRHAQWSHIDLEARTWSRPAELMKMRDKHVVTLSEAAVALLKDARAKFGSTGLVFPGSRPGKPLSDMSLTRIMRLADQTETVHGFRSAFRDWAAEKMPTVPAMVAEMALAHKIGTATERAYLRSDLRDMRHNLMDAWGRYVAPGLSPGGSNVVQLQQATA